jgi:hypothetical protein
MNYISDYLDNLLDDKKADMVFPSFQNVQVQDPLSKLIKWLHTDRGVGIKIKSEEDILIEDFLPVDNGQIIQLNLDNNKKDDPKELSLLRSNRRSPNFPTEQQKAILTELKKVPIYTVVNGNDEIILASPREQTNQSSLQWFYDQYYNWFIWKEDHGPITVGLFFSNKQDAESYLHEICLKDPRGAQNLGLNVKSTALDTFYYLNRTSNPRVQVRMISDLQELDELLRIHINKNFSLIHPKQKYGKNWFKGTPIYILRTDDVNQNTESANKKLIFFSKKDIEKILEVYKDNKKSNINKPSVEIYNLENYLLDLEKSSLEAIKKVNFFPPYRSYKTISENIEYKNAEPSENKKIKKIFVEKIKSIQRFSKGVIWLITSDTLPSEENSW